MRELRLVCVSTVLLLFFVVAFVINLYVKVEKLESDNAKLKIQSGYHTAAIQNMDDRIVKSDTTTLSKKYDVLFGEVQWLRTKVKIHNTDSQ